MSEPFEIREHEKKYITYYQKGKFYYSSEFFVCIKATSPYQGIDYAGETHNWAFDRLAEEWEIKKWHTDRQEHLTLKIARLENEKKAAAAQLAETIEVLVNWPK
jgi:hypothetical protein